MHNGNYKVQLYLQTQSSEHALNVKGRDVIVTINGQELRRQQLPTDTPARGPIGLVDIGTGMEFANLFVHEL